MSETKFDPTKHLRQLKGKGGTADYLDVKYRLVWLRAEHPDAVTSVEHVEISPDIAIFKATVSIPNGGTATDYGSETPRDFGDYIEKASTKALGRALAQLGYGTQFVGFELDENTRIVDSPVTRKADDDGHSASQPPPPRQAPAPNAEAPEPAYKSPYARSEAAQPNRYPELTWAEFKQWAQPLGYGTREACEKVIKLDTNGWLPGALRTGLETRGVEAKEIPQRPASFSG